MHEARASFIGASSEHLHAYAMTLFWGQTCVPNILHVSLYASGIILMLFNKCIHSVLSVYYESVSQWFEVAFFALIASDFNPDFYGVLGLLDLITYSNFRAPMSPSFWFEHSCSAETGPLPGDFNCCPHACRQESTSWLCLTITLRVWTSSSSAYLRWLPSLGFMVSWRASFVKCGPFAWLPSCVLASLYQTTAFHFWNFRIVCALNFLPTI